MIVPGRVSVLIPHLEGGGRAPFLAVAVRSAIRQGYPDVEVVVGITGGREFRSEGTLSGRRLVVRGLRRGVGPRMPGPWPVYERLLEEAGGEFVMFFSDDDVLRRDALSELVAGIGGAAVAYGDFIRWYPDRAIPTSSAGAFPGYPWVVGATIFRRTALDEVRGRNGDCFGGVRYAGEKVIASRLLRRGRVHVAEAVILLRCHDGQFSRTSPFRPSRIVDHIRTVGAMGGPWNPIGIAKYYVWAVRDFMSR